MSPQISSQRRETGWLNSIAKAWLWLMIWISYYKPLHFLSHPLSAAINNHAIPTLPTRHHAAYNTKYALSQVQHTAGVSSLFRHMHSITPGNMRWWLYIDSKRVDKNPVNIVTRLWNGQSRVQILGGARDFSLLNVQTGSRAHTASYSVGTLVLSRG